MATTLDALINTASMAQRPGVEITAQRMAAKPAGGQSAQQNSQAQAPTARDPQAIEKATQQIQDFVQKMAQNLEFSLDSDTNQVIVRVVSSSTKEVIRQIPSETMLELAKELDRVQGLLFSDKA